VIILGWFFCRKNNYRFYQLADPVMPLIAIGLGLGRLGNFINGELYGRVTTVPWGMVFPADPSGMPRHPSQLYEAFLEGFLLWAITYLILRKARREGYVFWSWIGLYGIFRFLVEFVRQPDAHLGYMWGLFTRGQVLSSFMILAAVIGIIFIARRSSTDET
jgi:phosphatidylglycerol:prolipoprotein diacylglycerol transferase